MGLAIGALILGMIGMVSSVMSAGQGKLNMAAVCFSSLLFSFFSLAYGIVSFLEKDKKYILSKIGLGISGTLVIFWSVLIIIGLRG